MTTFGSNKNQDWTATQAAPWRTPSPDAATMAAYYPPTAARQAYSPAFGQAQMVEQGERRRNVRQFHHFAAPDETHLCAHQLPR